MLLGISLAVLAVASAPTADVDSAGTKTSQHQTHQRKITAEVVSVDQDGQMVTVRVPGSGSNAGTWSGSGTGSRTSGNGSYGTSGTTGSTGSSYGTGSTGSTGMSGSTGTTGSGSYGTSGSAGTTGSTGMTGSTGTTGSGSYGTSGSTGTTGSGSYGTSGTTGSTGSSYGTGSTGSTGMTGSTGTTGSTGSGNWSSTSGSGRTSGSGASYAGMNTGTGMGSSSAFGFGSEPGTFTVMVRNKAKINDLAPGDRVEITCRGTAAETNGQMDAMEPSGNADVSGANSDMARRDSANPFTGCAELSNLRRIGRTASGRWQRKGKEKEFSNPARKSPRPAHSPREQRSGPQHQRAGPATWRAFPRPACRRLDGVVGDRPCLGTVSWTGGGPPRCPERLSDFHQAPTLPQPGVHSATVAGWAPFFW